FFLPDSSISEKRPLVSKHVTEPAKRQKVTASAVKKIPGIKKEMRSELERSVIKKLESLGVKPVRKGDISVNEAVFCTDFYVSCFSGPERFDEPGAHLSPGKGAFKSGGCCRGDARLLALSGGDSKLCGAEVGRTEERQRSCLRVTGQIQTACSRCFPGLSHLKSLLMHEIILTLFLTLLSAVAHV
ncbi:hypothetical protein XENOCAPTIV_012690, partial [Xenoophorus captivus]